MCTKIPQHSVFPLARRDGDKSTKDEDGDDNGPKTEKKEEEDEDDDPSSNEENPVEDAEVRDVRYALEKLGSE